MASELLETLPGDSRWVELPDAGGIQIHYVMAGEGSPVLLLHGLGASLVAWRDNIEALSERHRVYAIDMPGHGDSDNPATEYSLETYTQWLAGFQSALDIDRPALVGNSAGGMLALAVASARPEAVRSLVLVGAAGLGQKVSLYVRLLSIPLLGELFESSKLRGPALMLKNAFADPRFATKELVREIYRSRAMKGASKAVVGPIRQIVGLLGLRRDAMLLDELVRLTVPTMIVWGAEDKILPVEHARKAARRAPHARLHVFEGCGHWPQMERADEFNRLVLAFLKDGESVPVRNR